MQSSKEGVSYEGSPILTNIEALYLEVSCKYFLKWYKTYVPLNKIIAAFASAAWYWAGSSSRWQQ